jgi:hypothetical protein
LPTGPSRAIGAGTSYRVIPWQMGVVAKLLRLLPNAVFDRARRNARHRISGTLLAGCGLYLQFLEGPVAELDALWDQLQHDRRHTRVQLLMKNLRGAGRLYPAPPLALLYPATPLQFMALARDVRAHANAHAKWTMDAHALAALVDRSARRRERAGAAAGG